MIAMNESERPLRRSSPAGGGGAARLTRDPSQKTTERSAVGRSAIARSTARLVYSTPLDHSRHGPLARRRREARVLCSRGRGGRQRHTPVQTFGVRRRRWRTGKIPRQPRRAGVTARWGGSVAIAARSRAMPATGDDGCVAGQVAPRAHQLVFGLRPARHVPATVRGMKAGPIVQTPIRWARRAHRGDAGMLRKPSRETGIPSPCRRRSEQAISSCPDRSGLVELGSTTSSSTGGADDSRRLRREIRSSQRSGRSAPAPPSPAPAWWVAGRTGLAEIGDQGFRLSFDCEGPRPPGPANRTRSRTAWHNNEWLGFIEDALDGGAVEATMGLGLGE